MLTRDAPIQSRLMMMLLLTSGVAVLLSCAGFFAYEFLTYRQTMMGQLSAIARVVAANSTASLAFENQEDADEVLSALKTDSQVVAAALYDVDGRLFASYLADPTAEVLPRRLEADGVRFNDTHLVGFIPVLQHERRLGTLFIAAHLQAMTQRFQLYGLIAFLVALVALFVAFLLSSLLQRQISTPILALAATADAISRRRDYSVRARKLVHGEFGLLTDAFNHMLEQIDAQNRDLHESREQFRNLAESMPQIVWASGANGRPDYYNQRWYDYIGRERDQPATDVIHPDDRFRCYRAWVRAIASGDRYEVEYRLKRDRDNSYRWHIARASAQRDAPGHILRWIGTCTDIDDLKATEAQLRVTLADLHNRNRDLEDFAFVASHDLQEPLRKILAFSDRLATTYAAGLSSEGLELLRRSEHAARRMQTLIDDLLAYTRVHSAGKPFATVNLDEIVAGVLEDLEQRIESSGGRVDVGPLPKLKADATQMRQLFQNLIANALKFRDPTRPPVVKVAAFPTRNDRGERAWQILVQDNGIGIDAKYAERIFAPFQRLHSREEYEGTGIGLAIVRRIVERHGGSIRVVSQSGQGALFEIILTDHVRGAT